MSWVMSEFFLWHKWVFASGILTLLIGVCLEIPDSVVVIHKATEYRVRDMTLTSVSYGNGKEMTWNKHVRILWNIVFIPISTQTMYCRLRYRDRHLDTYMCVCVVNVSNKRRIEKWNLPRHNFPQRSWGTEDSTSESSNVQSRKRIQLTGSQKKMVREDCPIHCVSPMSDKHVLRDRTRWAHIKICPNPTCSFMPLGSLRCSQ